MKWFKRLIAVLALCCGPAFAQVPTCSPPDSVCYLRGAFLAGAPTSPTMSIAIGSTYPSWVGIEPWSWYESYGVFEYAGAVHLSVSGFAGIVTERCGRGTCRSLQVTDVPAPPVLYQATWNFGNNTIVSLDALVPIAWVQSTTTTVINGLSYTYNTWTYDGPLDAAIGANLEPTLTFALQASCAAVVGLGHCTYSGYQYATLIPLPAPSSD
jgi:hypothetical protein